MTPNQHRLWIKSLPCVHCGAMPCDAAHLRAGEYDKRLKGGAGMKPSHQMLTPLCHDAHDRQHRGGEVSFWADLGLDPVAIATGLWEVSGDTRAALPILQRGWVTIRERDRQ